MNLADARSWVTDRARNAKSSTMYSTANVDRSIMFVGNDFLRATHAITKTYPKQLALDDGSVVIKPTNVTTLVTATSTASLSLMPENLIDLHLSDQEDPLSMLSYEQFLKRVFQDGTDNTGPPNIAAVSQSNADETDPNGGFEIVFYPFNDDDRSLYARFWLPFITWSPGTTNTANIASLVLPDVWLHKILDGAAAYLQMREPEHQKLAGKDWKQYEDWRDSMISVGGLAVRVADRDMQE